MTELLGHETLVIVRRVMSSLGTAGADGRGRQIEMLNIFMGVGDTLVEKFMGMLKYGSSSKRTDMLSRRLRCLSPSRAILWELTSLSIGRARGVVSRPSGTHRRDVKNV